ncbi:MAG TPA: hypothetical protein VFQ72_03635 [Candidatus Paceibacterota bacterium]|nr:hypothetical protein [Candidatus Paceibacterota bacterium]
MAKNNSSKAGAIVAGIASITAAAIGGYYLYGHKDAAKNRAKVKGWMLKAKGEVLEELEKVQDVGESAYMTAVDAVAKKYRELKNVEPEELAAFIEEMKGHWQGIRKTMTKRTKNAKSKKSTKNTRGEKTAE